MSPAPPSAMSPALSRVRALCFDLDDTFWEVKPVLVRAEARVAEFIAERHPGLAPHLTAERVYETRMTLATEHPSRAHDMTWLRTEACLLYTSPSPRDLSTSRMPSSA